MLAGSEFGLNGRGVFTNRIILLYRYVGEIRIVIIRAHNLFLSNSVDRSRVLVVKIVLAL